jgi:hypothetical protein
MADAQGEKMNSEEKKQYPIFCVPPQKQENNGTHYQKFNFHYSSIIFQRYDLIPNTLSLKELSAVVQGSFNYFSRLADCLLSIPALASSQISIAKISVSICKII